MHNFFHENDYVAQHTSVRYNVAKRDFSIFSIDFQERTTFHDISQYITVHFKKVHDIIAAKLEILRTVFHFL